MSFASAARWVSEEDVEEEEEEERLDTALDGEVARPERRKLGLRDGVL